MIIKNINIRDFGIFQGVHMKDISPGLVVIGGFNRSGKSSFMEVIKHLGYGFTTGENLPEAAVKYELYGEVSLEDDSAYRIYLDGYKNPQVIPLSGEQAPLTVEKIYNGLDFFTYSQLFTITLEQLNNCCDGNRERLHSILLGAGVKEIGRMPEIIDNFKKEANKIGRTQGRPNTGMFKPYNEIIKENKEIRNKSMMNLYEYGEKKIEIEDKAREIENAIEQLEDSKKRLIKLDLLKSLYEDYKNKDDLEKGLVEGNFSGNYSEDFIRNFITLKENYEKLCYKYQEELKSFTLKVGKDLEFMYRILPKEKDVEEGRRKLYIIKDKEKDYIEDVKTLSERKELFLRNMKEANNRWDSLESVTSIELDNINLDELKRNLDKYENIQKEIEFKSNELQKIQIQLENLNGISIIEKNESTPKLNKCFYGAVAITVLSIGISLINYKLALLLLILGLWGISIYIISNRKFSKADMGRDKSLLDEIKRLNVEKDFLSNSIEEKKKIKKNLEELFNGYKKIINIPMNTSPSLLKEYLSTFISFKREAMDIEIHEEKNRETYEKIQRDMKRAMDTIEDIYAIEHKEYYSRNIISAIDELITIFEAVQLNIERAKSLKKSLDEKRYLEKEFCEFLNITYKEEKNYIKAKLYKLEKDIEVFREFQEYKGKIHILDTRILGAFKSGNVREALGLVNSHDEHIYDLLKELYSNYTNLEDIEKEYDKEMGILEYNNRALEDLKKEKEAIRHKIEDLSSQEDLEKAQEKIYIARKNLKPLAQKYAAYSSAAFLVEKVYKQLLSDAKEKVFGDSSDIFRNITGGFYEEILPPEDLATLDLNVVSRDGLIKNTPNMLSRGTKEQLFLSVRLSRIKEIKPCLPVIFDEPFVNFDSSHSTNTVEVLKELSKTHQIFFLTCHEHMVNCILNNINTAQYWKIESGSFTSCSGKELKEYLCTAESND